MSDSGSIKQEAVQAESHGGMLPLLFSNAFIMELWKVYFLHKTLIWQHLLIWKSNSGGSLKCLTQGPSTLDLLPNRSYGWFALRINY